VIAGFYGICVAAAVFWRFAWCCREAPPPLALLSTARDHTSAVDSGNHNIPFHLGAMLVPLVKMLNSHELKRGSCCRVSVCCVFMGVVAGGDPSNDTSSGRWHGVMHGQTLIIHPPHHSPPSSFTPLPTPETTRDQSRKLGRLS
jgi:hypothetical protein